MNSPATGLPRLEIGVPGLELITGGGLPQDRMTLVSGTSGSGKTVFACQFLASAVMGSGESGVFVTFEERPESIRRNVASLGWDIPAWEAEGRWAFVDASPADQVETVFTGDSYGLGPLLARIEEAVRRVGAKRVAIDSIGALVTQFDRPGPARHALFRLAGHLSEIGVTTVMTSERSEDYGPIAHFGFEEFVADNVVILRNALDGEKRRRTIEILKMRGGAHLKGEHLFTLIDGQGIVVVPVAVNLIEYGTSTSRRTCGIERLDAMLGGGLFERSLWMIAGPTGTGKSMLAAHFVAGGVTEGEKSLLLSFEESHDQIVRNAAGWGVDLAEHERAGRLAIVATAPESASLEDHLQRMKSTIETFRPDRVAIDSLTALQRISTVRSFREYILGLTFHIKCNALLGMLTSNTQDFLGDPETSDLHVSTISDAITLLHYVPTGGELRRGVQVLKMRGSDHEKTVREFRISDSGMAIGEPVADIHGLL